MNRSDKLVDPARRRWLSIAIAGAGTAAGLSFFSAPRARARAFEVNHTDAQWLQLLGPKRYAVLREQATEPAFSSPLDHEHRAGTYTCAACALALFSSAAKFDSGTGWPSFWTVLPNAVIELPDHSLGISRTAVECRRCGGHLGHVFDDGPRPTGLRYCMNGLALVFVPSLATSDSRARRS